MKYILVYSTDEKLDYKNKNSWKQVGTKVWNSKEEMDNDESIDNYSRMIVPNIDRGANGTIGKRHHDGKSKTGGVVDRLDHEQKTLAGCGGVSTSTSGRGSNSHRHC